MKNTNKLIRPLLLTLLVSTVAACGASWGNRSSYYGSRAYYPYDYPWYYTGYGTYTVVRRPVVVVDGWTTRAFGFDPYSGFTVSVHHSPVIVYTATKGDRTFEVDLTENGDSTRVEVKARRGESKWDKEQAKILLGHILQDYKQ